MRVSCKSVETPVGHIVIISLGGERSNLGCGIEAPVGRIGGEDDRRRGRGPHPWEGGRSGRLSLSIFYHISLFSSF